MFTNGHIFSVILGIFWNYCKSCRTSNSRRRGKRKFSQCLLAHMIHQGKLRFIITKRGSKSFFLPHPTDNAKSSLKNARLPISLFLPTQERQGHVGLQTSWSFFDLLGYFAAHCPAVENHDETGLVIGTLFSQVPWEKKGCVKPLKKRERRGRLNLSCYRIYSLDFNTAYSMSELTSETKAIKKYPQTPKP